MKEKYTSHPPENTTVDSHPQITCIFPEEFRCAPQKLEAESLRPGAAVCSVEVELCAPPWTSGVSELSGDLVLYEALGWDGIRPTSLDVEGGGGNLNQEPLIPSQVVETGAFPRFLERLGYSATQRLNSKYPRHCVKSRFNIQISFFRHNVFT